MRRSALVSIAMMLACIIAPINLLRAASRIKDVASFQGVRDNELLGYGLVVGLNGSGDRSQTFFTTQTLANMLERSGLSISPTMMRVKNIAAVVVTATLPPFIRQGVRLDVTVSSMGDAQSLQGGILIFTPLKAANNDVYATAQGPVIISGYSAGGAASRVQSNHPTVGRVPNGAIVQKDLAIDLSSKANLSLVLHDSDFTTASRAVRAINDVIGSPVASALDGRTILINVPETYAKKIVEFMALVENAKMDVDVRAKVVINEKTGTIIMGREVKIAEVSIIHGSLSLQVGTIFNVSQPAPLSQGKTVVVPETTISVQEDKGKTMTLREGASVEEVVKALNSIGAGPRDITAILQAIKAQGALQADLEII